MPYDETLAERVRAVVKRRKGIVEKKMFGGIGVLLNGNMSCGIWKSFLIVRVGLDAYDEAMSEPFVRQFDITGKSMKGWVMVDSEGTSHDDDLREWVDRGVKFARTLPAK